MTSRPPSSRQAQSSQRSVDAVVVTSTSIACPLFLSAVTIRSTPIACPLFLLPPRFPCAAVCAHSLLPIPFSCLHLYLNRPSISTAPAPRAHTNPIRPRYDSLRVPTSSQYSLPRTTNPSAHHLAHMPRLSSCHPACASAPCSQVYFGPRFDGVFEIANLGERASTASPIGQVR